MIHLPLPRRPKRASAAAAGGAATKSETTPANCCCLSKLIRRLMKRRKTLQPASRQSSLQCRYDPLSYALNFDDRSSSGDFEDEDYYRFYAFSSRFVVANPRTDGERFVEATH